MKRSLLLFTFAFSQFITFAQFTDDANSPSVICNAADVQKDVNALGDGSGGYFVFWIDNRNGSSGSAIYGQHLDVDGNALWPANGKEIIPVNGHTISTLRCAKWLNGAIIAWIEVPQAGYADSILCQRINNNGDALWPDPVTVSHTGSGIISMDSPGFDVYPNSLGAIIGYSFIYSGGAEFYSFNRVDASGNLHWPVNNFSITYNSYYNYLSCSDGLDGIYVLMKGNGYGSTMVVQRYDTSGTAVFSTPLEITGTAGGLGGKITMRSDATGSLYVTWDAYGSIGVAITKVTANGGLAWPSAWRDVSDFASSQNNSYSILLNNKIYVVWDDNRPSANNFYIYAQKLDTSGVIEWNTGGRVVSTLNSYIPIPKLVNSDSGSVVATYEVAGAFYAQKLRPDSTIKFAVNGAPISNPSTPFYADYQLVKGNEGCIVAFWSDDANDIYAGRICSETATGLEDVVAEKVSELIYPNPTGGKVSIHIPNSTIQLFDMNSRLLYETASGNNAAQLDLSHLAGGIYLIVAETPDGIYRQKLVKE